MVDWIITATLETAAELRYWKNQDNTYVILTNNPPKGSHYQLAEEEKCNADLFETFSLVNKIFAGDLNMPHANWVNLDSTYN